MSNICRIGNAPAAPMMLQCHLLLAVHLASATFINTNLRVPYAAIAPNQLRIYKEYTVQQKYANTDQSEGINEEGQKLLVNCTIRSTNATSTKTGKIIKRTTANCTVTHDDVELEMKAKQKFTNEQRLNAMKEDVSEMIGSSVLHDDNLETYTNNTDVSNVSINEQQETRKTIKINDSSNKESRLLIPAIVGAVTSHSQAVGEIGERNLKVDEQKIKPTFEIALLHSSNEKQIVPAVFNSVQRNNDLALKHTLQNDTDEAILLSRSANNEFTLTEPVNGSIHQYSNATEHKCDETTTASRLMDGLEQITSGVSGDTKEMEFSNDTRGAFINKKTPVVKSGTDKIQIFRDTTEKIPEHLNEYDPPGNNYSFDNSGRLIEKQTPINVVYTASIVSEKPLQRQPESTTKPSSDWRHVSEQSPEQLFSKPVNNSFG
ncbi:hypothetical protein MSG28_013994 [Choristoneura fumiferana]|uniref:Uncharacterized protein n=1 Tax=Choristoneura fumiferana TaxID=7141 RepID=A0ACC0K9J6_CHOFU|nr:hypothetical protein MSG28_013994 [Choristoneura fumiferana]